ncbi:MAG: exodeoxyribonuclease III, partial [Ignavibacteria bacterium]
MKLISWNVNGLRAIAKKGFLEWVKKEKPDILCLQETKAWKEQLPDNIINIPGYKSYFSEASKKGYSGTALYTKVEPGSVSTKIGVDEFDSEGRFLIAEFDQFILFNIYFPNGKKDAIRLKYKLDFYEAFLDHVKNLLNQNKKIVVCGDVNTAHKEIDLARPKQN